MNTDKVENARMKTYMSIRQAAQYTGLGESFLRKAVRNSLIPGFFIAGEGSKFMVNVPLLLARLDNESQKTISESSTEKL